MALVLLGGAGFYIYSEWARNSKANDDLNEIYAKLTELGQQTPAPGNDKVNNIATAKEQDQELRRWIISTAPFFQPIVAIPAGTNVSSKDYAAALSRTLDQMQRAAESAGVTLPPKYGFSFEAQRSLVRFAPGSLDALAAQLGEVKAITDVLYASRVNAIDSIQRVRVSDDDAQGAQADYLDEHPTTNDLAIITPYVVTFRCFTTELARVLDGFKKTSSTFIVKTMNVVPASTAGTAVPGMSAEGMPGAAMAMRMNAENPYAPPVGYGVAAAAANPQTVASKGGLQPLLKEQLLRVVIEVGQVKLVPKS